MDGSGIPVKLPKQLMDIVRTVHQTKWNLIKTRQELNRSYKEVCTPVLDKCRYEKMKESIRDKAIQLPEL